MSATRTRSESTLRRPSPPLSSLRRECDAPSRPSPIQFAARRRLARVHDEAREIRQDLELHRLYQARTLCAWALGAVFGATLLFALIGSVA